MPFGRRSAPRRRPIPCSALAALALCLSAPAAAQAQTLVVDKDSIGGPCDDTRTVAAVSEQSPWCSLSRALSAAPEGSQVLLRAGSYPGSSVKGKVRATYTTFKPYGSEAVTVAGLTMEDSSSIRIEGLRFTSRLTVGVGSQHIQIVGNELTGQGLSMRVARDVLIEGNYIHDLTYDGVSGGAGYGIWLNGSWSDPNRTQGIFDVVIRGNLLERIPADGIQMGSVDNVLVENNRFTQIKPFIDPTEHSDGVQMYGTSKNVTLRGNVFHDTVRGLIAKGMVYPGLVIENNLMVRLDGTALNIYDAPGVRIVNNTIWDVPLGLRFRDLPEVPEAMDQAVVANNILQSFEFSTSHVALEDYNLIGQPLAWQTYGPHDVVGTPSFSNPTAIDYRLLPGSIGIDSALGDIGPLTDRLGLPRSDIASVVNQGSGVPSYADIGAHETQAVVSTDPTEPPPLSDPPPTEPTTVPAPAPEEPAPAPAPEEPAPAPAPGKSGTKPPPDRGRKRTTSSVEAAALAGRPSLELGSSKPVLRLSKRSGRIRLKLRCSRRCRVRPTITVRSRRGGARTARRVVVKPRSRTVASGRRWVTFRLGPKNNRQIARALRGRRATAMITLRASDRRGTVRTVRRGVRLPSRASRRR